MSKDKSGKEILSVENLKKYFPLKKGVFSGPSAYVRAVDGIDFKVKRGETFALVGESGSGKTTTGRLILRLMEPSEGKINFDGVDILSLNQKELRKLRRRMQIIFQDPYSSLNPRMTVYATVAEPLTIHKLVKRSERQDKVVQLLKMVGIDSECLYKYPHEFSGGQRQRIGIARALAVEPEFIVADEPVSSLDVSVQAQVVNLLMDLQEQLGLTYLLIAHDLRLVETISDSVAVMYLGKIMEYADSSSIYSNPKHPYTIALLSSVPIPDPEVKRDKPGLKGDIPTSVYIPSGCRFRTRCPIAEDICAEQIPSLEDKGKGQLCACHLVS